jgi:hypothetical protein
MKTPLPALRELSATDYHADAIDDTRPSLSASLACVLLAKSPAHAYVQHPRLNPEYVPAETKKAWDLGTVAHSLLLEGYANVHVVEGVTDWRTKDAQAERDTARTDGKVPMLRHEFEEVSEMVDMAREELAAWDIDPAPLTDGKPEQTITWDEDGVLCRCRPDWLRNDFTVIEDVKTTAPARGADPKYFARKTVYEHGYDVRAAMYLRGVKAVTGVDAKWRWIVVETKPPFVVSIIEPSALMLEVGNAKLDSALAIWRDCLATGLWPAYGREVHIAEPPSWELRWLDNSDDFQEEAWATM